MNSEFVIKWTGFAIYMAFYLGLIILIGRPSKNIFKGLRKSWVSYGGLWICSFLYALGILGPSMALLTSISLILLVKMVIFIRESALKKKGSYEGEFLLGELLREYRVAGLNIYTALEKLTISANELKITKRYLRVLLYEIRATGNPAILKEKTDEFARAVGTNWARMLAYNIYIGASRGSDISIALEDTLIQLRDAKSMAEERKRLNSETFRMVFIMIPSLYFITIIMATNFLEIPLYRFLSNQFATSEGLMFFYFIVFLFICNIALVHLILTQKLDY